MAKSGPSQIKNPPSSVHKKKAKRFLGQNDALKLAASIAGLQEEKAQKKAKKHETQVGQPRLEPKARVSPSKIRLKERKALIAAERARVKKNKAKLRKQLSQCSLPGGEEAYVSSVPASEDVAKGATQKRVSFA